MYLLRNLICFFGGIVSDYNTIDFMFEFCGFGYKYEYITNKFRNKAAHAASIDDKAAEECCAMIIGKIEAKEKIENINSVLKQTFELISKNACFFCKNENKQH